MQALINKAKVIIAELSQDNSIDDSFNDPAALPMVQVNKLQNVLQFEPSQKVLSTPSSYGNWYREMLKVQASRKQAANAALTANRRWLQAA